jgi:endonuclease/exonuclease/phosphatase family metal-dependent hydrolase
VTLTVITLNMLDDLAHWEERAPLILACFDALRPDVIALQEVALSLPPSHARVGSSAHWLADRLGGYDVFLSPGGEHPASDSLAVLTQAPGARHDVLSLGSQGRQAQRVDIERDGVRWTILNTHLYWNPFGDAIRRAQVGKLLEWVHDEFPVVVCGDLNAMPGSGTLRRLTSRFDSAHQMAHGSEPVLTYPTMLRRGSSPRHWSRHAVLLANGLVRLRRNVPYGGTVDYILVDRGVRVLSCDVVLDHPSPHDPRIFASDHVAISAVLESPPVC